MFDIRVTDTGTVELKGSFDAAQESAARPILDQIVSSTVVDFRELKYISSAGLGLLLFTQKRLMASGHALSLVNLNAHISEIFNLAGFRLIFDIAEARAPE